MKHLALISLVILVFSACKSDQEKLQERIAELEQIDTGSAHLKELAGKYMEFLNKYDADSSTKAKYLSLSADYYVLFEQYDDALVSLRRYHELSGDSLYYYSKKADQEAYCYVQSGQPEMAIKTYEKIASTHPLEPASSLELTKLYLKTAEEATEPEARKMAHLKGARMLVQSGDVRLALDQLTSFYTSYPNAAEAPYAMMESASILERHINDLDSARSVLESLIEKYPEDPFARDAKIYLEKDLLGKSDMEQFEIIRKGQGA